MLRNRGIHGQQLIVIAAILLLPIHSARAQYIPIYGGATYTAASQNGYTALYLDSILGDSLNNNGAAVGFAYKYINGSNQGDRALRWGPTTSAMELGNLSTNTIGAYSQAFSINDSSQVAGNVIKYLNTTDAGNRAVRWDVNGSALELANLGTDSSGATTSNAYAINNDGKTAGYAYKYVGGVFKGYRCNQLGTAAVTHWNWTISEPILRALPPVRPTPSTTQVKSPASQKNM